MLRNTVKTLFAFKLGVLAFIANDHFEFVSWGEKESLATEDGSESYIDTETVQDKTKKDFIESLIDLPQINSEEYKKTELAKYFTIVEKKARQIEDRIKFLKKREKQFISLESSISDKLKKLDEEMLFFKQTIQKEKQLQDERLQQLIGFYRKMPAKKAAPVFEKLDKDLVVALFKKLPEKQSMQILSLMNPEKSKELSEYFGRLTSGKEYDLLSEINGALRKEFNECAQ